MKIASGISRFLVGALFIFSGLIKANDPLGFSYKLEEYFDIFGLGFFNSFSVWIAIFICVFEVFLGFATLIGSRMKFTSWSLLLMIIFFTFLTGYSAIYNKVTDCGCFGDAIKLTPWQSFWKDIILLGLILIIFIDRNKIRGFFTKILQTNILIILSAGTLFLCIYAERYKPPVNFLKFKEGADIKALTTLGPDAKKDIVEMVFVYKVNGESKKFKTEELGNLPEGAEFVSREDVIIQEGDKPQVKDFKIFDKSGIEVTDTFLNDPNFKILVTCYDLNKTRKKAIQKLGKLANELYAKNKGFQIWALTSTPSDKAEAYRHEHQLPFEFYNADQTMIKSIMRSNPGVLLIKGSEIIEIWSAPSIPSLDVLERKMKKK